MFQFLCPSSGISHTGYADCLLPVDGHRNCVKHVEFYSQNKSEKFVHLIGFIIRINHDARSSEYQIQLYAILTQYVLYLSTLHSFGMAYTLFTPKFSSSLPRNSKFLRMKILNLRCHHEDNETNTQYLYSVYQFLMKNCNKHLSISCDKLLLCSKCFHIIWCICQM